MPNTELAVLPSNKELVSVDANAAMRAMEELKVVRSYVQEQLKEGLDADYGKIPGTGKKVLLKPGAEKVGLLFNIRPVYDVDRERLEGNHLNVVVYCRLVSRVSDAEVGAGVGSCTTLEDKYLYASAELIPTGMPVPKAYWENRDPSLLGGKGYVPKKIDGQWQICKKGEKSETTNPANLWNTVLKMAKKRALIDAVLGLGCLSELFTQDIEDTYDFSSMSQETQQRPKAEAPKAEPETEPPGDTAQEYDDLIVFEGITPQPGKSYVVVNVYDPELEERKDFFAVNKKLIAKLDKGGPGKTWAIRRDSVKPRKIVDAVAVDLGEDNDLPDEDEELFPKD